MSYLTGDYTSLAEACGDVPSQSIAWCPGENFDPHDSDEMEVMHLVWEREKFDRIAQLERENARLRSLLYRDE